LEKGREQGLQEGKQYMALQIAASLLDVQDDTTIASKTGLSGAQVAQLRFDPGPTG